MAYEGDIMLANGITQANHQNYALIEASAVYIDDNNRLTDKLSTIDDAIGGINDDRGVAGGIATLNNSGVLDPNQVPSYTVNVLEGYIDPSDGATITHFYATRSGSAPGYIYTDAYSPEANKFYTELTSNRIYRWNGSAYIEVSESLKIGTTSDTAFAGDKGQDAYAHAVTNKGSAFSSGFYKITTNAEGHVTAADNVAKADITALGIPDNDALDLKAPKASPVFTGSISLSRLSGSSNAPNSFAVGLGVSANGTASHVFGTYNKPDSYSDWPEWQAGTYYDIGAKVKLLRYFPEYTIAEYYVAKVPHMNTTFDETQWDDWDNRMNYVEIVGNGLDSEHKSNARTLDWQGNEVLAGGLTIDSKGIKIGNTVLDETTLIQLINMLYSNQS